MLRYFHLTFPSKKILGPPRDNAYSFLASLLAIGLFYFAAHSCVPFILVSMLSDVEISGLSFSMAIDLFAVRASVPISQPALPTVYCQLCSRLHHRPFHFVASLSRRLRDVTAHNCLIFLQLRSWEFNFLDELPMVFLSSSFSGLVTAEAGFDYFEASLPPIHLYIHGFVAHGIDIFLELYQIHFLWHRYGCPTFCDFADD